MELVVGDAEIAQGGLVSEHPFGHVVEQRGLGETQRGLRGADALRQLEGAGERLLSVRLIGGEDAARGVDGAQGVHPVGLQRDELERLGDRGGERAHRLVRRLTVGIEADVRHREWRAEADEGIAAEDGLVAVGQPRRHDVERERH